MKEKFEVVTGMVDEAITIMREVAAWCLDSNLNMWKLEDLTRDKLIHNLTGENFCVAKVNDEDAASMILQWHDLKFWPEVKENESGFVHKLCIRRNFAGMKLSTKMVDYAIDQCKIRGIDYLRLDTNNDNPKLCSIYESLGFIKVGKKTIGSHNYALYELRID